MIDLFSAAGLAAIARLTYGETLYAFDFDGTLAPIVSRPEDARASTTSVSLLSSLGRHAATLLLTGRAVDDLRERIAFAPTYMVGNHGAEGMPIGLRDRGQLQASRAIVERWLAQLPRLLATTADPGIEVEPKSYSLSIHYRAAADQAVAASEVAAAIERLDPKPHVIGGKCVFNLLPEGAPDKGSALVELVEFARCSSAFFIGDDLTDESVFSIAPPSWVTVRVGRSSQSAARYCIPGQRDIDRCLELLIASVEAASP